MKRPPCFPASIQDLLDYVAWAAGGDTGASSEAIFAYMTGLPTRHTPVSHERFWGYPAPSDQDDFGRCLRLVQRFPSFRRHLKAFAADPLAGSDWKRVVQNWSRLEGLHEVWKRGDLTEEESEQNWKGTRRLIRGDHE